KGMKDSTQQQHLMTPETVALFVGYLAAKLTAKTESLRIFDPVSGTANLLTTVMNQLTQQVDAYAGEVDPTLIQLALSNANLQRKNIEFCLLDSLRPFLLDTLDLIVADVHVGYYPDVFRAQNFKLHADVGYFCTHHLLI